MRNVAVDLTQLLTDDEIATLILLRPRDCLREWMNDCAKSRRDFRKA